MTQYPALMENADGSVRIAGEIEFTSTTNQPASALNPVVSGTLPNTGAWVSGTAKVNPVARPITVAVEIVGDATNNIASCVIALSADNSTFTTLATPSLAAAVNNTGAITMGVCVPLPQGWYIKLTLVHTTVAASIYYQMTVYDQDEGPLNSSAARLLSSLVVPGKIVVYGFLVYSTKGSAQYLNVFDANTLPADNAVPLFSLPLAANNYAAAAYTPRGRQFQTGLVLCCSSTDTLKTLGSADCFFDVQFDVYPQQNAPGTGAQVPIVSGGGGGGGPAAGSYLPVANKTGVTVNSTTYNDTIKGGGAKLTTLVFPADQGALAIAISGDAFPRWVFGADAASSGMTIGDGTTDSLNGPYFAALGGGAGSIGTQGTGRVALLDISPAGEADNAPRLDQLSPVFTITSGALPTVQLVTATGAQISTTRDAETVTPCTFNPGAATTATVTVALSPDNVTYSTLAVVTEPAGVALDGTILPVTVRVPAGWYLKLTVNAQAVLGLTTYY